MNITTRLRNAVIELDTLNFAKVIIKRCEIWHYLLHIIYGAILHLISVLDSNIPFIEK